MERFYCVGCYNAAQELKFSLHKDISVVGVSHIPTAQYVIPPLTTVRIYMDFIGETAFELLDSSLKQGRDIPLEITVASKLKIRKNVYNLKKQD